MPLAQKRLPGSGWTGLEHGLSAYFAELRHFESTRQLRVSALYRRESACWEIDHASQGFEWIDFEDRNQSIISFLTLPPWGL